MKPKRFGLSILAAAGLAVGAVGLQGGMPATALAGGTAAEGTVTVGPASGNSDTTITLSFSTSQSCPGDFNSGYLWQTFIAPRSLDPATFTYYTGLPRSSDGSDVGAKALRTNTNSWIRNKTPGLTDGQIVPPTNVVLSNATYSALSGEYWLGIACTQDDLSSVTQTVKYWAMPITITPASGQGTNNFTYETGFTPKAPTLGSLTAGEGEVAVAFTPAIKVPGNPDDTGYTVVVKDATCTNAVTTGSGVSSPITVSGLTNGTTYCFAVKATNPRGDSALSSTNTAGPIVPLAATPGNKSVTLSWSAGAWPSLSPISDYKVEYRKNGGAWTNAKSVVSTATTFVVNKLTNGTNYEFRVAAKKGSEVGSYLVTGVVVPRSVPGKVRSLKAVARNTSLNVTWVAPSSNGGSALTDYVIEYSSNSGTSWSTVSDGVSTNTTHTITGLVNATGYKVRVSAQNVAGSGAAVTTAKAVKPYLSLPTAPQSLKATPRNLSVVVTWKGPKDDGGSAITDYLVEWTVDGVTWSSANAGTALTYTIPGLVNGTGYKVRVSATNTVFSGYGKTAGTAKAVKPYLVLPGKVRSLKATTASRSLNVSWSAPSADGGSDITDYLIEISSNGGVTWVPVSDGVSTATTYQITGLVAGTGYKVRISARNLLGTGAALTTAKAVKPLA